MKIIILILVIINIILLYKLLEYRKQNYRNDLFNLRIYKKSNALKKVMFTNNLDKVLVSSKNSINNLFKINTNIERLEEIVVGHSNRMAYYAYLIGKKINLSDEELNNLYFATYFHDIGKYKLDTRIISKKLKLTNREYDKIQFHPLYGSEILSNYFNKDICNIVKYHHERIDGSGYYNEKITDKCIMIIGIVDSFDAMFSNRVYKSGMCMSEIKYEFKMCTTSKKDNGKGIKYNKEYVDIFLNIIDDLIKKNY